MKITELTRANPIFRTRRKAITLGAAIQRRLDYLCKVKEDTPTDHLRATSQIALLNQFISRLDNNELIPPPPTLANPVKDVLNQIFNNKGQPSKANLEGMELAMTDLMTTLGRETRASVHAQKLRLEIAYRAKLNWFMIFDTLTVSPGHYMKIFSPDSRAFNDYIRRIKKAVRTNKHDTETRHTYFAVVEEGGLTGRLHIHCLHFLQRLPLRANDPNTGLHLPYRRELSCFKSYWPHGNSNPIMVRYSLNDAFGIAGYRWPYDKKTEKGLQAKGPHAIAGYMTKYVTKSYISQKRDQYQWRIRKTQNLGAQIVSQLVSTLTTETLNTILHTPTLKCHIGQLRLSNLIFRHQTILEIQNRTSIQSLSDSAKALAPLPSLLIASRDMTQRNDVSNLLNNGPIRTTATINEATYNKAQDQINKAAAIFAAAYFSESAHNATSLSTRPNY